jgi:hypothetical protein
MLKLTYDNLIKVRDYILIHVLRYYDEVSPLFGKSSTDGAINGDYHAL